eukprot:jgi/Tetstr1/458864/TSEL_004373.t1
MWAKETFTLKAPPSKGYISKLLKAKSTLLSTHSSLSSKNASRKRKRFAYSEPQARLEELLLDWIRHHDATHGGKVPLSDMMILEQAKLLAAGNELVFDEKKFNYSSKWLLKFKQANNINRMRFHDETADADLENLAVVRQVLPSLLQDTALDKIYNFDETGLWYRMLLTAGNVVGAGKDRRGAKTAKDRVTVGLTVNATGTDFWKPVFIGKAKRPRCFGKHWKPEQIGALYYNNETAWMRSNIWVDIMDQFNRVGLAADVSKPVRMVDAVDLLDMPLEREVFEPPAQAAADTDEPEETVDEIEHTEDDNVAMVPLDMDVDVDEMEPERAPTLQEVRGLVEKVFLFVTENAERVNASVMVRDYNSLFAVDILREGLAAMHTSNRTRQASVREFFPPAPRPPAP